MDKNEQLHIDKATCFGVVVNNALIALPSMTELCRRADNPNVTGVKVVIEVVSLQMITRVRSITLVTSTA